MKSSLLYVLLLTVSVSFFSFGIFENRSKITVSETEGFLMKVYQEGVETFFENFDEKGFESLTEGHELVKKNGKANFNLFPNFIGGFVWQDYNFNGQLDEVDTLGVEGVKANLYDCDGSLIGSTTTDNAGIYLLNSSNTAFSGNPADVYRLEFVLPDSVSSWAKPTQAGNANGTMVQFLQSGDVRHLGLASPADFCQNNPYLVTSCFIEGDNSGTGDVLVSFLSDMPTSLQHESIENQIGTTFGLAYQRASKTMFASAFIKRFAGLDGSPGSIFKVTSPADGATTGTEFIDLNTLFGTDTLGADPHDFTTLTGNGDVIDANAYAAVGKIAYGDLDISGDEKSLWTINLNDRGLYKIPLGDDPANPVAPSSASEITVIPLVDGDITAPNPLPDLPAGITEDEVRPFALKVKNGIVYIGVITNGEDGGSLNALVYAYDVENQDFTKVLELALSYNRGCALSVGSTCYGIANWNAWTDTYPGSPAMVIGREHAHPQPLFGDLDFDASGNMLLGLRDRFGDQTGYRMPRPNGANTLYTGDGLGDILLASPNGTGGWTVDIAEFTDNTLTLSGNGSTEGENFFGGDYYEGANDLHEETTSGGLVALPGQNVVVSTNIDPITSFSAGIDWFNTSDGSHTFTFEVLGQNLQFNKANGLGELEAVCDPAPIEIGNYVWDDVDGDGIQDPCETGIQNVAVSLFDSTGVLLATTTTDANGQYYFSHTDSTNQTWTGTPDSITANTMFFIVIGDGQYSGDRMTVDGTEYSLTIDSTNSGANRYAIDSDGEIAVNIDVDFNGLPYVKITTGNWGASDHTFDFGFFTCLPNTGSESYTGCSGDGYSVTVGVTVYDEDNPTGLEVLTNVDGCDSTVTVNLVYNPTSVGSESYTGCSGDMYSVTVNGTVFNENNPTGTEVLTNALGCDSTVTINLVYNPTLVGSEDYTGCEGDGYSVTVDGTVYDENNPTGMEVLTNALGCDSTVTINLVYNASSVGSETYTGCTSDGYSVTVDGTVYDENNPTGTEVLTNALGCDSTVTINLQYNPNSVGSETYTGCIGDGYSVTVDGTGYDENNPTGTEVLTNAVGCDSTVTVNLVYNATSLGSETYTGCAGDGYSVTVDGTFYDENNPTGTEILTNVNGCDSTVTVNLVFSPNPINDLNETLCTGSSILVNGTTYDEANPTGTEIIAGGSTFGCDSTINVTLTFNNFATNSIIEDHCDGDGFSILVNGTNYDQNNPSGTETIVGGSYLGCDSIITINLSYNATSLGSETYTGCASDGYSVTVDGTVYDENNASGMEVLTNALGCDSTVTVNLVYNATSLGSETYTGCVGDGYSVTVDGTVYDENNPTGTEVLTNAVGCDSTVTVNLVYNATSVGSETYIGCMGDGYSVTVDGTVYDENNPTGTEVLSNVVGCDSTVTINLQYNPNSVGSETYTGCAGDGYSVTVDGTVYDENNPTGTEVLTNAVGCDSTVTVNLVYKSNSAGSETYMGCVGDGYSVTVDGTVYDENNPTGTEVLTNAMGCDSTVTVNLVFSPNPINDLNETLCTGSSILVNGTTYDEANPTGTEIIAGGSTFGCDSTINVNLTFNNFATNSIIEDHCDGDGYSVLVNGTNYDQNNPSGMETIVGGSYLGCDSIITINLSYNATSLGSETYTGCAGDGYSVTVDGTVYDESNLTGTEVLTNAVGCDSTVTVNLVYKSNSAGSETYMGCVGDGYSVTVDGTFYDENNPTGTEILTNAVGCDSTVTVNLVYNAPSTGSETYTGCAGDGYSVTVDGTVYDENNLTGTEVLTNAVGCDSTVAVNLVYNPNSIGSESYTGCEGDGYSVTVNSTVYDENNKTGTEVLTNALGCDSTVTINLTYNAPSAGSENYTGCEGDGYSVMVDGIVYDENNATGTEVLANAVGCDSTVTVNLVFYPNPVNDLNESLCVGGSIVVNGTTYDQSNPTGTEVIVGGSSFGCDSTINVTLTFISFVSNSIIEHHCDGDGYSILVNGTIYDQGNTSGVETIVGGSYLGCDSIITITLSYLPNTSFSIMEEQCEGDGFSIMVNGTTYDENNPTGTEILMNANDCDSTVTVNLQFLPTSDSSIFEIICNGEVYSYEGQDYTTTGIYEFTYPAANGCDSTFTLDLTVQEATDLMLAETICPDTTYNFYGQLLSASGIYYDTLYYASGCDSIRATLDLTVLADCTPVFDLALRKTLAAGQAEFVSIGDTVEFTVYIFNQGNMDAYDISMIDYQPIGFDFLEVLSAGWVDFGAGPAWFLPFLPAGGSDSLNISFSVNANGGVEDLINYAEISSADDDMDSNNTDPTDTDSTPNAFLFDDPGGEPGSPADDVITGDGTGAVGTNDPLTDEDDMDGAEVQLIVLTLGNLVFEDFENDGIFNNNDEGIEGVTVKVFEVGADGLKGTNDDVLIDSTVTDINGEYLFEIIEEGLYYVKLTGEGIPADYVSSTGEGVNDLDANGPYEPITGTDDNVDSEDDGTQMGVMVMSDTIRLVFGDEPTGMNNNENLTVDFGLYEPVPMTLGNQVFEDKDNDGIFNNSDVGIVGVEVELYDLGDDGEKGTNDDNLIDTQTTDGAGQYQFTNLTEGLYYVKLNGNGIPVNFVSSTGQGPFDMDGAGPFEPAFNTDSNLDNVDDGAQMGAMVMSDTIRLTLDDEPEGNTNNTVDFGLFEPREEPSLTLGNQVFEDKDNDAIFNNDDMGIEGVEVELYDLGDDGIKGTNDDNLLDTQTTDSIGQYQFIDLLDGLYYVKLNGTGIPSDFVSSTGQGPMDNDGAGPFEPAFNTDNNLDNVDDGAQMGAMVMSDTIRLTEGGEPDGDINNTVDFGLYKPDIVASLGDLVWFDDNVNGQQDNGENGVPGVEVYLFDLGIDGQKGGGDDNQIDFTTTDIDGLYLFANLLPGSYYVQFDLNTLPSDYFVTTPNDGNDTSDSDANSMGMTDVVTLMPNEDNTTLDMGIYDPMFDLALFKTLAPTQPALVDLGDDVTYQIRIVNEGLTAAHNVVVTDHIPAGLILSQNDQLWTLVNDSTASYTIPDPIPAGGEVTIDIVLTVQYGLSGGTLTNIAEVDSATDPNGIPVDDIDSTPDNDDPGEDDIDEEEIELLEHDPTGWIYCEKTGEVISGGTITVTGPNGIPNSEVIMLADGQNGFYEFFAVGLAGTYTIQYTHPNGFPLSVDCLPGGVLDPTNLPDPTVLGSLAVGGYLNDISCTANPYYLQFDLELGDPVINANNIPVQCTFISSIVCEDTNNNDTIDVGDQPVPGVTVYLYDCADQVNPIDSTISNAQGGYSFNTLVPGNYMVGFDLAAGARFVSNGPINQTGLSDCIVLNWGECDTSKTICIYYCPDVTAFDATICYGNTAQLITTLPYGNGTYSWSPITDLNDPNIASPMASPLVTTTYTVTYADGFGCVDSDTAIVDVLNTTPFLTFTPFTDSIVECNLPVPFDAPFFTDNCDQDLTVTLDSIVINLACGYLVERTWIATNDQGNTASFVQTVTVVDTTPPAMSANHAFFGSIFHGDTLYADCSQIPSLDSLGFSAFDLCCATTVTFDETVVPGDCVADGYLELRYCGWTATDCCGNTDSLFFTVIVTDLIAPVLDGVPADVTVTCGNVPSAANVTATDNCDPDPTVVLDETVLGDSLTACYLITRTWTATDSCGNLSTDFQYVMVTDFEPPVLQNVPASGISDCSDLTPPVVTAIDNCDTNVPVVLDETITADSSGCITQVDRTWTAFDDCGNMAFATQTLIVQNNDAPVITVTNPMMFGLQDGDVLYMECQDVMVLSSMDAIATADCCGAPTIEFHEFVSLGDCLVDGYLQRMDCGWTATDCCGNVSSLSFTVFVVDNSPPILIGVPGDMMVPCLGDVPAPPTVTATDNCFSAATLTFNEVDTVINGVQVLIRIWTATDDCGNIATESQTISFTQQNAPAILNVPADITVPTTADVPAPSANVVATDDCDPDPLLTVEDVPTGSGCCYFITRTWTATDDQGLVASGSQIITVQDMEPPVITGVPDDVTAQCHFLEIIVTPVSVSDNCTINPLLAFTQDTTFNTCGFDILRTWTAIDECGNSTSVSQTIVVGDNLPPTMNANHAFFGEIFHGDTLFADCTQIPSLDSLGFAATDDCSDVVITFDETVTTGDCATDGFIEHRYCGWTATDDCGNTDSLFFWVLISDNIAPVLSSVPGDLTVTCDGVPINDAIVTATDDCTPNLIVEFTENVVSFSCFGTFTLERTWSAIDSCGNVASDTQTITVFDLTPPAMTANHADFGEIFHGDTLYADCSQIASLDSLGFAASDECGTVQITFEETVVPGNCASDGFIEWRYCGWTATDLCGNSDSLFFTVIILDNEPPILIGFPTDLTLECDETLPTITVTATDNCSGDLPVTYVRDSIPGVCIGTYVLENTWSAIDSCGNAVSGTQTITVVNDTPPSMTANHIFFGEILHGDTLFADCTQIPSLDSLGFVASDPCCDVDITFEETVMIGDCAEDGYIELRNCGWTATDCCGNSDSLFFTVIVQDLEGPVISGVPSDTLVICGNVPDFSDATVTDNCDDDPFIYSLETISKLECPFLITRVWIAEDDCGNVTMDTQFIQVVEDFVLDLTLVNPALSGVADGDTLVIECSDPDAFNLNDAEVIGNCGGIDFTFDENYVAFGDCLQDGFVALLSNIWSATDDCGNDTSISVFILYVDTEGPVFADLPVDTTISCGGEIPAFGMPTASDACGDVTLTNTNSVNPTAEGVDLLRTWTATDDCGNQSEFTQTIHVIESEMPILENITVSPETCENQNGAVVVLVEGDEVDFSYTWIPDNGFDTDAIGNSRSGLAPGDYEVIVSDGPCSDTFQFTINMECDCIPAVVDSLEIEQSTCGVSDGSATISLFGDITEYTFTWIPNIGTANPLNNGRTGLPAGHYVVIMVHDGDNSCVSTVEFDVFDDCNRCGPMFEATSLTAQVSDSFEPICLPVPFGVTIGMDITIDGVPYAGAINECDVQDVIAYNYSILPNSAQDGPFSVLWEHDGTLFSTVIENMDQLAAGMTQVDANSVWNNDKKAFQLISRNLTGDYGSLYIYSILTEDQTSIDPNVSLSEMGTYIELPVGFHQVVFTDELNDCSDMLEVTIEMVQDAGLFQQDTLIISGPCDDGVFDYCFEIPAYLFDEFNFTLNGQSIDDVLEVCNYKEIIYYSYAAMIAYQPPYQVTAWSVNGDSHSATFNSFDQLESLMNQWDPTGDWILNANNMSIEGGNLANSYSSLNLQHPSTGLIVDLAVNTLMTIDRYGLQLQPGLHNLSGTNFTDGSADNLTILLACLSVDYSSVTVSVGETDTVCLDMAELPGAMLGEVEICGINQISNANIELIPGTACFEIQGGGFGTSQTCLVVCDEYGFCDTTYLKIRVLPKKQGPPESPNPDPDLLIVNNGFSPNGDNINDFFTIKGLQHFPDHTLTIFDHFGTRVFTTKNYHNDWGGTWGQETVKDGTYYYLLEIEGGKQKSGYVQILR